jgi:beta-glucosidase
MVTGVDYWSTPVIPGYGPVRFSDGPHGLRLQNHDNSDHLGLGGSAPATCFPPAVTLASSWDPGLIHEVGAGLGREARSQGVHVVLGPGMNIKRSPLCGRNFEYFSEDPLLSGLLAAAMVGGIQSEGVAACVKHFAANNQETDRLRVSADVDERALREIYLRNFEIVIKEANPWTVMAAYNKVNGVYASENAWLLTDVLRTEWGYDGVVVSDWGAVNDPVAAVQAGMDMRMPGRPGDSRVRDAQVEDEVLDRTIERLVLLAERTNVQRRDVDLGENHELVRRAAAECAVLLKNDRATLPLDPANQRIAIVGELARTPRFQGAGSSLVSPTRVVSALDAMRKRLPAFEFAAGYTLDDHPTTAEGLAEAVDVARQADVVVVFLGLPESYEAEGRDRSHIDLPQEQLVLLDAVSQVASRLVVALSNGSVVSTASWRDKVDAIVEFGLTGQAHGDSVLDVLLAEVTPSGKLAETVPVRLMDTPAYLDFPGENGHVRYGEGIFVGYRYYDTRDIVVDYPFGHGLSYTEFRYSDLRIDLHDETADTAFTVSATIANIGHRPGAEVAQVYVADRSCSAVMPAQELCGFFKVRLAPGETQTISIPVARQHLRHYDVQLGWIYHGGDREIRVGSSSRDVRLTSVLTLPGGPVQRPVTEWSTLGEWDADAVLGPQLWALVDSRGGATGRIGDLLADQTGRHSILGRPAMSLAEFPGFPVDRDDLATLLASARST